MRVLVVEDEARLARQIASALTEDGHDPAVIHDGATALRTAMENTFDLIVLDLGLPTMDGFEVLRQIRAQHLTSRVLVLTARGQVGDRVTHVADGMNERRVSDFLSQSSDKNFHQLCVILVRMLPDAFTQFSSGKDAARFTHQDF